MAGSAFETNETNAIRGVHYSELNPSSAMKKVEAPLPSGSNTQAAAQEVNDDRNEAEADCRCGKAGDYCRCIADFGKRPKDQLKALVLTPN